MTPLELMARQFRGLSHAMAEGTLPELGEVLHHARTAIPGVSEAAIAVAGRRGTRTIAATSKAAAELDALQFGLGRGTAVAVLDGDEIALVSDLTSDDSLAVLAAHAAELGVRSMLSVRLGHAADEPAAITFYAGDAGTFGPAQSALASIFAACVSLLLAGQAGHERAAGLARAVQGNREISVAIGILMARNRWSRPEALERLVASSQDLNRRLVDVATEVIATRRLPTLSRRRGGRRRRDG